MCPRLAFAVCVSIRHMHASCRNVNISKPQKWNVGSACRQRLRLTAAQFARQALKRVLPVAALVVVYRGGGGGGGGGGGRFILEEEEEEGLFKANAVN